MFKLIVSVALVFSTAVIAEELKAIVKIEGVGVSGNVTFTQKAEGAPVSVEGTIKGLKQGEHGFHVHAIGDITGGCLSTGSHFNPDNKNHGAPTAEDRHVGDLGNIEADATGIAHVKIQDSQISLCGRNSILGRAVVVHSDKDDLGLGNNQESLKTGNAGSRVGCGVIGILSPEKPWSNSGVGTLPTNALIAILLTALLGQHFIRH